MVNEVRGGTYGGISQDDTDLLIRESLGGVNSLNLSHKRFIEDIIYSRTTIAA